MKRLICILMTALMLLCAAAPAMGELAPVQTIKSIVGLWMDAENKHGMLITESNLFRSTTGAVYFRDGDDDYGTVYEVVFATDQKNDLGLLSEYSDSKRITSYHRAGDLAEIAEETLFSNQWTIEGRDVVLSFFADYTGSLGDVEQCQIFTWELNGYSVTLTPDGMPDQSVTVTCVRLDDGPALMFSPSHYFTKAE